MRPLSKTACLLFALLLPFGTLAWSGEIPVPLGESWRISFWDGPSDLPPSYNFV